MINANAAAANHEANKFAAAVKSMNREALTLTEWIALMDYRRDIGQLPAKPAQKLKVGL